MIRLCTEVPTYGGSLLEVGEEKILQIKNRDGGFICRHTLFYIITHPPVPIIVVFTKYDTLVKSIIPQGVDNDNFYGDIEEEIDNLNDHDISSTSGAKEPPIDASFLSLADKKLRNEMIKPFEKTLNVPWVA